MPAEGLKLRAAGPADAERLREWRNDPETVTGSLSGRPVEPDEHEAWLGRVLDDPDERLFVVEEHGEPVGQVRLQRREGGRLEVHIGLASSARGRGLGRRALELAWDEGGGEPLVARVLADNERSLRAFNAAGFREASRSDAVVTLERRS